MKYRTDFVTNSSSDSFMVMRKDISDTQMAKIADYRECARQMGLFDWDYPGWSIAEDKDNGIVHFGTYMDDFLMRDFLENIGVGHEGQFEEEDIRWNGEEWWADDQWSYRWDDVTRKATKRDEERSMIEKVLLPEYFLCSAKNNASLLPDIAGMCAHNPDCIWRTLGSPKTRVFAEAFPIAGRDSTFSCLAIHFPDPLPGECYHMVLLFTAEGSRVKCFTVERPIGDDTGSALLLELEKCEYGDEIWYHSHGPCAPGGDEVFRRALELFEEDLDHGKQTGSPSA